MKEKVYFRAHWTIIGFRSSPAFAIQADFIFPADSLLAGESPHQEQRCPASSKISISTQLLDVRVDGRKRFLVILGNVFLIGGYDGCNDNIFMDVKSTADEVF